MNTKNDLMKHINSHKTLLVFGIILMLIGGLFIGLIYYGTKEDLKNPIAMNKTANYDEGTYAYIDVKLMTDYFATYSEDDVVKSKYYFVWDDNYSYIACLNEDTFKQLKSIFDYSYREGEMEEPKSVRIYGNTTGIADDLKKLAIENYNKIYNEEFLNDENAFSYLGMYYLNTAETPQTDAIYSYILFGIPVVLGIVFIIIYILNSKRTKKTLEVYGPELEKIKMDIYAPETLYNKPGRVYLTNEYILSYAKGLEIFKYEDIVWIYPYELKQNGFTTQKSIHVVTKDAKAHVIANMSMSKKKMLVFDELYNTLLLKVPNALHGYSKENSLKAKEMYKK